MSTTAETAQALREALASMHKTNTEIIALQATSGELVVKITTLEARVAELEAQNPGTIPQEITDLVTEVVTLATANDEAIPDPILVPTSTV